MVHAEGTLRELPTPTLHGAIRKLEMLWEVDRYQAVEAGAFFQHLIWDLNRLSSAVPAVVSDLQ